MFRGMVYKLLVHLCYTHDNVVLWTVFPSIDMNGRYPGSTYNVQLSYS